MTKLLTTAELAQSIGLATQTVRNLLHTHPEKLPRADRMNGMRKVLFRADDVESFLVARKQVANNDSHQQ